jgi:mRNA interferase RelE/StbE
MSKYRVFVQPRAWKEIKHLPGNMRQRVKRAIDELASDPRLARSKALESSRTTLEVRRIRLEDWRVIYVVNEELLQVQVLTIRQRPPYTYDDLDELLDRLE